MPKIVETIEPTMVLEFTKTEAKRLASYAFAEADKTGNWYIVNQLSQLFDWSGYVHKD